MSQKYKKKKFRPETTVYHGSSKILPALVDDVVNCYRRGYKVCKYCYYRKRLKDTLSPTKSGKSMMCSNCGITQNLIWLMPSSDFCENFGSLKEIPIPPTPKWSMERVEKPFNVCSRSAHFGCYDMSATSEVWFAHTVEELVIWTIEREYKCSFWEYIEKYYKPNIRSTEYNTSVIIKDNDLEDFSDYDEEEEVTDSSNVIFRTTSDIPKKLLKDIINSYKKAQRACRYCFYYKSKISTVIEDKTEGYSRCSECLKRWNFVLIIPSVKVCNIFGEHKFVPISIPAANGQDLIHQYCNKKDHYRCFEKYVETGFKYAHSIEELAIWTIEKEYGNFSSYVKSRDPTSTSLPDTNETNKRDKYMPGSQSFLTIGSIPSDLLLSVCKCYDRRLIVCRPCFFQSIKDGRYNDHPQLIYKHSRSSVCEKGHHWKPLKVIPCSKLCNSYGTHIGVPPFPRHMHNTKGAFQVCNFKDHNICFQKTRETNPWFPHTIEEIVIWTVERETNKDFTLVYKDLMAKLTKKPEAKPLSPAVSDTRKQDDKMTVDKSIKATSNQNNSSPLNQDTLTEGVHKALPPQPHSNVNGTESPSISTGMSVSPLLFVDDDSDNDDLDVGTREKKHEVNVTDPSYYFPALTKTTTGVDMGGATAEGDLGGVTEVDILQHHQTSQTDMNSFLSSQVPPPPASMVYSKMPPVLATHTMSLPMPPGIPALPAVFQPHPPNFLPPVSNVDMQHMFEGVSDINVAGGDQLSDDDDDWVKYECYLCYREFVSAKSLASHTSKKSHVDLLKKDFDFERMWRHYPFPPDQAIEDFTLCTNPSSCPGRLKCSSAHSIEEKEEWTLRYKHRNRIGGSYHSNSPAEVVNKHGNNNTMGINITPGLTNYHAVSVKVTPAVHQKYTTSNIPRWKLSINSQGWQTLLAVECMSEDLQLVKFEISAIKGDTMYTIRPRNRLWIASTFEESVLLGNIVVIVRGVSLPVGSHECHVRLHFGTCQCLYVVLQATVVNNGGTY